eukprot:829523-Rhodomonas_salina.1
MRTTSTRHLTGPQASKRMMRKASPKGPFSVAWTVTADEGLPTARDTPPLKIGFVPDSRFKFPPSNRKRVPGYPGRRNSYRARYRTESVGTRIKSNIMIGHTRELALSESHSIDFFEQFVFFIFTDFRTQGIGIPTTFEQFISSDSKSTTFYPGTPGGSSASNTYPGTRVPGTRPDESASGRPSIPPRTRGCGYP